MYRLLFLVSLVLFSSCEGNNERILAGSTGRFNELLVVVPQNDWEGEIGFALKEVLTAEVLGLPQPEPQFSIIRIEPHAYNGLLLRTRNIMIVEFAKEKTFTIETNVYADPQIVIKIKGTSSEEISAIIRENAKTIVDSYKRSDLLALQKKPAHKPINLKKLELFKSQKFQLNIPNNFKIIDNKPNFLWCRNETYNPGVDVNGSMNIIAYTLPLEITFEQVKDSIASIRDKIGKNEIPGPHEGTYMITEEAYTPHVFNVKIRDLNAYKTLGKWEIKDGFMAGPFISYTIEDKTRNRLIVVEGFVYAPSVNKRDYLFELEAILGTFKIIEE